MKPVEGTLLMERLPLDFGKLLYRLGGIAMVAGGAARYYCGSGTAGVSMPTPEDYDVFLLGNYPLFWEKAKAGIESLGYEEDPQDPHTGSIMYRSADKYMPVQLVNPNLNETKGGKAGSPLHVIESFGLYCEQAAVWYDPRTRKVRYLYPVTAQIDNAAKRMQPTGRIDPEFTLRRLLKYAAKGYELAYEDRLSLFLQWERLSADERDDIRDRVHGEGY